MKVHSFLAQGPNALSILNSQLSQSSSNTLDALALFHLNIPRTQIAKAIQSSGIHSRCPRIYLSDSYGIIGYDETLNRNVELMEKGRGQEYGFRGGSGGEGCVAVSFSSGAIAGHDGTFPENLASMMVISDGDGAFAKTMESSSSVPVHYGGISKENYILHKNGDLERIPFFWIGSANGDSPVGISAFEGDASDATRQLMEQLPESGSNVSGDVGLFPCFTRGVNQYEEEDVETSAVVNTFLKGGEKYGCGTPRCYGSFAHGELGPSSFMGFVDKRGNIPCIQHSGTSILSIHTVTS